jgi:hypothetical protein
MMIRVEVFFIVLKPEGTKFLFPEAVLTNCTCGRVSHLTSLVIRILQTLLRITEFLDFAHRPEFKINRKHNVRNLNLFSYSGEWRETSLLGSLQRSNFSHQTSEEASSVGISLHLNTETDEASKTFFYIYLEFRAMDKVQKPSDSECVHQSQNPLNFIPDTNRPSYV